MSFRVLSLNTLGSFFFRVMLQTNKQTDRQTNRRHRRSTQQMFVQCCLLCASMFMHC